MSQKSIYDQDILNSAKQDEESIQIIPARYMVLRRQAMIVQKHFSNVSFYNFVKTFFALLFIVVSLVSAHDKDRRILDELVERKSVILHAAKTVGISPRIVASVLYAERYLNYNWDDEILDNVLAQSGYNSSVGFGQIKITTAFWVEQELNNSISKYYLGNAVASQILRSATREKLIKKVTNDSVNILYCAAYLAMVQYRWKSAGIFLPMNVEAGILGTLYSLGVINSNGEERTPHPNPQMNKFGFTAQEFFDSLLLRGEFE
jgi:hypothetical protein